MAPAGPFTLQMTFTMRLANLAVIAALALLPAAACGGGSGPGAAAPTGPGSPTSATPGAAVSGGAGSGPTAAPSSSPATCRLPVAGGDAPADGNPAHGAAGHGGFVQIPAGSFAGDPSSLSSYDRAHGKWLPVPRAWISPDGGHFAYAETSGGPGSIAGAVHVIDIASGSERAISVPPSIVIDYEAEGIYLARVVPNSGAPSQGLSVLDPASNAIRPITAEGTWTHVGGGAAYGADLDPAVPAPAGGSPGTGNRIRRLQLDNGAISTFGAYPNGAARVLGMVGSSPVVGVTTGTAYTVTGPAGTIFSGPAENGNPTAPIVVDGPVIWLSSLAGHTWRYAPGSPAVRTAGTGQGSSLVAGACR